MAIISLARYDPGSRSDSRGGFEIFEVTSLMIADLLPGLIPALALYPEIHYRFKYFPFSRYWRRTPEIIADAPCRLEPGQPLPLLFIVKCAHRFPLRLERIDIEARVRDRVVRKAIVVGEALNQLLVASP